MKRLSLLVLVILMSASAVFAHDGSIGLYFNTSATDCDATLPPFTPTDVYLIYYKSDGGPDGITGAECRVEISSAQISLISFTEPAAALTNGNILTGIGIVFTDDCFGGGQDYILLGTLSLLSQAAPAGWTAQVLGDPRSQTGDGLNVAMCGGTKPLVPVLGGFFVGEEGACNVAVESSTWGAVKSMYSN